jgi:hypothetical protein
VIEIKGCVQTLGSDIGSFAKIASSIPLGYPDGSLEKVICFVLLPAEKLCTQYAPKIAWGAIFHTPIL